MIYNKSDIFKFSSNRNILQMPKSILTLKSDIESEHNFSYSDFLCAYYNMVKQINEIESIDLNIDDNRDDQYKELIIPKELINKNLYSINYNNFLLYFINKNKLDKNNICRKIYYSKFINNDNINNYIKRFIISKFLFKNKESVNYYNYQRYKFLIDILNKFELSPISYNNNKGIMYFTFPYSKNSTKEQIIENMYNSGISIEKIQYHIVTSIGDISKAFKHIGIKSFKTNITDSIIYLIPNIVRVILIQIMSRLTNKNNKISYKEILNHILKNNNIVENYCEKIDENGKILRVPINDNWQLMDATDVRKLTINDINIPIIFEKYNEYLKLILDCISL